MAPRVFVCTPIPAWKPTPAVTVEGGPNAKAERADKVPYVRYAKDFTQKCGEVTHTGHMRTLLAADEMVDRIMTTLQADGELENTLVIFTSDNGWSWDERGLTSKGAPWTEHVQAPLLVRWDGVFPPGTTDEEYRAVMEATPLGRWGGEIEIAKGVLALIESDFITGETIRIDGGRHVK